jgi:hypothetical protein
VELGGGGKGEKNDRVLTISKYICAGRGYNDMY